MSTCPVCGIEKCANIYHDPIEGPQFMTETKTETLADVLRDLIDLAPNRFEREGATDSMRAWIGEYWVTILLPAREYYQALIVAACMEEIAAQKWDVYLFYDSNFSQWSAEIQDWSEYDHDQDEPGELATFDAPDLADAIATALRDALKAETP